MKRAVRNLKMRQRKQTHRAIVFNVDTGGLSVTEMFTQARQRGAFTVPFHFLVHAYGLVEEGRPINQIGDTLLNPEEDAIIIVADIDGESLNTTSQIVSLMDILSDIKGTYEDVKALEKGDLEVWKRLMTQK